jgi:hypothetical protein
MRGLQSPFQLWLRLVLGALGAGSFGAGAVAVFVTQNGTGAAVLITFGGILMVLALLGDRIESFEFGGTRLRIRAAAAGRLAAAAESERLGDTATAARLRAEARTLLEAAGPIASDYRVTRDSMRPGRERTIAMSRLVAEAGQLAGDQPFDPAEVSRWLREGSEEERITALGMMLASPALRDFAAVLAAISASMSAFEQYHALRVAEQMLDELSAAQRQDLAGAIEGQRGPRFRADASRLRLSERILAEIAARASAR